MVTPDYAMPLADWPADKSLMPRRAVYACSPAHLVTLSRTLSAELADTGVQVQALCPGAEDTQLLDVAFQRSLAAFAGQSAELASRYRAE